MTEALYRLSRRQRLVYTLVENGYFRATAPDYEWALAVDDQRRYYAYAPTGARVDLVSIVNVSDAVGELLDGTLMQFLFGPGEIPLEVQIDLPLVIRLENGLDLSGWDVLRARNMEIRRRVLEFVGNDEFCSAVGAAVVDKDGENSLLAVEPGDVDGVRYGPMRFASVKDASTPRRYVLRVPPEMTSVRAAVAWTFGMAEDEYRPEQEA